MTMWRGSLFALVLCLGCGGRVADPDQDPSTSAGGAGGRGDESAQGAQGSLGLPKVDLPPCEPGPYADELPPDAPCPWIDHEGRCHDVEGVTVEPRYTQDPCPPIWLGGTVPQAMERAAAVADGFLGTPTGTGFYRSVRATLAEACEDYEAFSKGVMVNAFVADSTEAAVETVEPGLHYLERRYARWLGYEAPDEPDTSSGVYGTPAEVVEGIREYEAILGGENVHCLVRLHFPDVPREASDRAMELFADEVLPEL